MPSFERRREKRQNMEKGKIRKESEEERSAGVDG